MMTLASLGLVLLQAILTHQMPCRLSFNQEFFRERSYHKDFTFVFRL